MAKSAACGVGWANATDWGVVIHVVTRVRVLRSIAVVLVALAAGGCSDPPSQEELEQIARGPQASRDRVVAAKAADHEIAALRKSLTWLDWQGTSKDQMCDVQFSGAMMVPGSETRTVVCSTRVTGYAGFSGNLVKGIRRFDAHVTKAGWEGDDGVYMQANYYRRYRGRPQGERTYDASNLPEAGYNAIGARHITRCTSGPSSWGFSLRWLESGQPLGPHERHQPTFLHAGDVALYERKGPLDHLAVKTRVLTKHRYAAVITLSLACHYAVDD